MSLFKNSTSNFGLSYPAAAAIASGAHRLELKSLAAAGSIALAAGLLALPAQAHHPLGGKIPANAVEGFLSGLAHPVIGPDHFVFVVAIGLLAALSGRGMLLPAGFVLATLAGTAAHLQSLTLPGAEIGVALTVVIAGAMLAASRQIGWGMLMGLGAIAGFFHGYAYGEAIVGAQMSPLVAYLAGFAVIQMGVALAALGLGRRVLAAATSDRPLNLRFAGFVVIGAGAAFLSAQLLG
jgi:urease accessory protein